MSKKRTKAQKKKSSQARANVTLSNMTVGNSTEFGSQTQDQLKSKNSNASLSTTSLTQPTTQTLVAEKPIIRTQPKLIKRDLLKSLLVSILLLGLLLGIYLATRYNVISLPFFM